MEKKIIKKINALSNFESEKIKKLRKILVWLNNHAR